MSDKRLIGFTCGSFDLLHAGHISMLRWCKDRCTHLVVGLQLDPSLDRPEKNKPIQTMYERYAQLAATRVVDEIMPYETEADLLNLLACEQFQARFLGDEYIEKDYTGKDVCDQVGTTVVFYPRKHTFSSSELRQRVLQRTYLGNPEMGSEEMQRMGISPGDGGFPEWAPGIARRPDDDDVPPVSK